MVNPGRFHLRFAYALFSLGLTSGILYGQLLPPPTHVCDFNAYDFETADASASELKMFNPARIVASNRLKGKVDYAMRQCIRPSAVGTDLPLSGACKSTAYLRTC